MAEAGRYVVVVRNDKPEPDVVHDAIWPDTREGRIAAFERADRLHERSGIPFTVSIIDHRPVERPRTEGPCGQDVPGTVPSWAGEDQIDPCPCALPVGHDGGCKCRHDLAKEERDG